MKKLQPITVTAPKPRNPLVAASRMRRAGSHRGSGATLRQQSQRTLKRELDRLRASSP